MEREDRRRLDSRSERSRSLSAARKFLAERLLLQELLLLDAASGLPGALFAAAGEDEEAAAAFVEAEDEAELSWYRVL